MIALLEREPNDNWPGIAPADYFDVVHQSTGFADVAAWRGRFSTLTDAGATDQIWSVEITEHLFALLGSRPVMGRNLQLEDFAPSAPEVALLSYRQWVDRFAGSSAVLGRTVVVNDKPHTVIGVMPRGFLLPGYLRSDIFLPFRPSQEDRTDRTNRGLRVCALLKPGVSFQQASAVLQRVTHNLQKQWPRDALESRDLRKTVP